jgi:carbamoyl-phosphate synthase large subunit
MVKETVLITATGSIIGEGIIKCLKLANTNRSRSFSYEIVTADMRVDAAGLYRGHHAELIPSPRNELVYRDALVKVCKKYSIRAIFCGSDEELLPLARLCPIIEKETGARVITNPLSTLEAALDKWKTHQKLKNSGVDCAESTLPENRDEFTKEFGYPLIIKPRSGHGSQNLFLARNSEDLDLALKRIGEDRGDPILQEFLPGEDAEYTTGVVTRERKGAVLSSISMRRRLKHGQTYKAFIEDSEPVRLSSERAAVAIGGVGPVNVQSRLVDGISKVFEINPRFSASCPIRAVSGVNEPDIVFLDQVMKEDVSRPKYRKLVGMRYWSEVYVPIESYEVASRTGRVDVKESFVTDYF